MGSCRAKHGIFRLANDEPDTLPCHELGRRHAVLTRGYCAHRLPEAASARRAGRRLRSGRNWYDLCCDQKTRNRCS
ncbi:hypothetical protein Dda3937_04422 [Dickeya dadantii 3937]|uniref:Uncharacterized protein n=1 Tax=Dickeya dadantii (strain 3937) TaxID=198628 RepID=E0SMG9_DICD3|nr:hypothetical protein Dda3937_04422 [Dickeya dadantii 3937]